MRIRPSPHARHHIVLSRPTTRKKRKKISETLIWSQTNIVQCIHSPLRIAVMTSKGIGISTTQSVSQIRSRLAADRVWGERDGQGPAPRGSGEGASGRREPGGDGPARRRR